METPKVFSSSWPSSTFHQLTKMEGFRLCFKWFLLMLLLRSPSSVRFVGGDDKKDKEECTPQLAGMATCLPYVSGDAKTPTPDCCSGLKEVLKNNKKCLCVIVKDRNDPDLGLQINVTLALGLPDICHATANVSNCPGKFTPSKLLHSIHVLVLRVRVYSRCCELSCLVWLICYEIVVSLVVRPSISLSN